FLMPTHARSGQAKLFNEGLAQFRVLVDLVSGPRIQPGRFSLNTDCVRVAVSVRGHPARVVGDSSSHQVHGAVTCQEQLREGTRQPRSPVGNYVQRRAVTALRSGSVVTDHRLNGTHRPVTA